MASAFENSVCPIEPVCKIGRLPVPCSVVQPPNIPFAPDMREPDQPPTVPVLSPVIYEGDCWIQVDNCLGGSKGQLTHGPPCNVICEFPVLIPTPGGGGGTSVITLQLDSNGHMICPSEATILPHGGSSSHHPSSHRPSSHHPSSAVSASCDGRVCVYVFSALWRCSSGGGAWDEEYGVSYTIQCEVPPVGVTPDTWVMDGSGSDSTGPFCSWSYTHVTTECCGTLGHPCSVPTGDMIPSLPESGDACCSSTSSGSGNFTSLSLGSPSSSLVSHHHLTSSYGEHHHSSYHPSSYKATAIVPASWSPSGYTALYTAEMPEVRFDDVLKIELPQKNVDIPIDPRFLEVCEAGTIEVCGIATDLPILIGAVVDAKVISVKFAKKSRKKTKLVIRLTGIRRGFRTTRFGDRTAEQFIRNEKFINSAY